jgi:hypothetical protein
LLRRVGPHANTGARAQFRRDVVAGSVAPARNR